MVRFLSGRIMVMYSVSAFSDLWTSVDGMLVLTSVSTPPLGLSAQSTRFISYPWMENLCVFLRWVSWMQRFEELLKFKFLLSHPFCIPIHDAKCLVTGSSTLSEEDQSRSQSHWLGPFEAEGPALSHPGCDPPGRHHNNPKITSCYR